MKLFYSVLIVCTIMNILSSCDNEARQNQPTLKDALKDKFLIGVALNKDQITGKDTMGIKIIQQYFNSVVAENCMKSEKIHPEEDVFDFMLSDQFVDFGEKNGMVIIGHVLIWHSQLPEWFCVDENGKDVSPEVLKDRMKSHIATIVRRYKGRIKGWDVVNEAINDDGSYRKSKFYEILGEDYISLAFQYANEEDPNVELYYSDYSLALPQKREGVVRLIKKLKEKGIRIDAVSMQGHLGLGDPPIEEFEKSILAFAGTGVKIMITELDMSVLPFPAENIGAEISSTFEYDKEMNPYTEGLPANIAIEWNNRMGDFFKLFLKHSDIIDRVTLWGVADANSWKNNWPIKGRTDYPLLFDQQYKPKIIVDSIVNNIKK